MFRIVSTAWLSNYLRCEWFELLSSSVWTKSKSSLLWTSWHLVASCKGVWVRCPPRAEKLLVRNVFQLRHWALHASSLSSVVLPSNDKSCTGSINVLVSSIPNLQLDSQYIFKRFYQSLSSIFTWFAHNFKMILTGCSKYCTKSPGFSQE